MHRSIPSHKTKLDWAPEDELLIRCCSVQMSDDAMQAAQCVLQESMNWADVLETSIAHAVSPLLYCGLEQVRRAGADGASVPAGILEELRRIYRASQVRSRRMYRVVGDVFKAFKSAGVHAMALKDVQLARVIYPEPGLRPMGDIDILIRREQYPDAARCMNELGFIARPRNPHFTLKYAFGHMFHRANDNVWVDLQWNIMQREYDTYHEGNFEFQVDQMWRRAEVIAVDDFEMLAPTPEDMLFHLCMHLEGHKYTELILFCDIVELLRHYAGQLNWQYVCELTKTYGAESAVYYVLFLVRWLYDVSLPSSALRELEPDYFKANLFEPLFESLTPLHLSLDDIRLSTRPFAATMTKFEESTRRQTVGAMHVARVFNDIVSAFERSGGGLIIASGTASQKIFPDPALPAFDTIDLFIAEQEVSCMRRALEGQGFRSSGPDASVMCKESKVESGDPVLANAPTLIDMCIAVCGDVDHLLMGAAPNRPSKREIALKVLRAKLWDRDHDTSRLIVHIRVVAIPPEALLLYLAARLGTETRHRLFGLVSLLEVFRSYKGPLDWKKVMEAAEQHGIKSEVSQALRLVSGFVAPDRIPVELLKTLEGSAPRPRCLESARYDPESYGRFAGFRMAFFYLLSLLSTIGAGAKLRYLVRTRCGGWGVVPRLFVESVKSLLVLWRGRRKTTRDFAFWMEAGAPSPPAHATAIDQPQAKSVGGVS
jgi:hypothetical protein